MKLVAGVDIGNATTEIAIAWLGSEHKLEFVAEGIVPTTGMKGTNQNIHGVVEGLKTALTKIDKNCQDLALIAINEAAPVIGDVAMETITETIITESTMIGHNPDTPGGMGMGIGQTILLSRLAAARPGEALIVVVPANHDFEDVAKAINQAVDRGLDIQAAILQGDDGVLVCNRLKRIIPVVDEVTLIDKVPIGVRTAVEVAQAGRVVESLSNPYGIATAFGLSPDETRMIVPIARALIGTRSAVVLKTLEGDVKERIIPAGKIHFKGQSKSREIDIDLGSEAIMETQEACQPIEDICGESGTHVGGMLERVRQTMARLTDAKLQDICIQDVLAVDSFVPQAIKGGLAGEFSTESAVALAAMVKADRLQMQSVAAELAKETGVEVRVGGVEADMAIRGAQTTPGSRVPIAIVDMGAGSTDASYVGRNAQIHSVHLAGAGNMVTLMIDTELGLDNLELSEDIKKYPLAKVDSLFHIRHEDGTVQFFEKPLSPEIFARVIILREHEPGKIVMVPIPGRHSLEAIRQVRRESKEKIFVTNSLRALARVCPTGSIRDIDHVILVGGSSLDFEVPQLVTDALSRFGVVAGRGNIRGTMGPRNAVATGLILAYGEQHVAR